MANIRFFYFSEALQMQVGVNVILPENTWGHSLAHRPEGYRYPVLWLQSGGGFDYTDWQRYTALELYASEAGVAVVCSGTYCSGYMDTKHGDFKYFTQLSVETPQVVRHLFPLSEDPKENYIAGFSMGGYGSMKWLVRDPEKFAAFGLFSGLKNIPEIIPEVEDRDDSFYMLASAFGDRANVLNTEDDVCYMIDKQMKDGKKFPRGYMATGMEDTHYEDNVRFMDKYASQGIQFERIIDHGAHNWEYCNRHVKQFLDWLDLKGTYVRGEE
jgi:S-formylglutathione hydrolase FrmB